jgi:hypothetical protein
MRGRGLRENIRLLAAVGTAAAAIGYGSTASADTLEWALVQAYQNNPSRNALRAVDENVPQALSGYRPKLSVTASGGYNYLYADLPNDTARTSADQRLYSGTTHGSNLSGRH